MEAAGIADATGAGVFAADQEVGEDLAVVDWSATPIGEPSGWPQSLRTAVSILLSSRFPMWMAWGPRLTFFCNAAYRRDTLGQKYPWALGRPADQVWEEIWDDIGPRIEHVLATGRATWDQGLLLFLERSGYPEETYHTFSYSPLRDDWGTVVGMLCVVSEDTERVIGERRMATLRDLGSDPSVARTEQEMLEFAASQLGRNQRDLPFTLTYLFDDDGGARLAATTGIVSGHPAAPGHVPSDSGLWPAAAAAQGRSVLVDLGDPALGSLPTGAWPTPPAQALVVPLLHQGSVPVGFVVAALNRYRPLDEGYRGFVDLIAGHVAGGILSARSYRAQLRRAEELAELDRAKTAFFSNISHEFRTPLTLITGPVQELRTRLADAEPVVRAEVEVIHRNGLRLGKLVNALLDFSRIEAGRMRASYEPVDLAAVTGELASVFRSAIEKAGLRFEVDCLPLAEPVHVDRGMWEKVILNLLSNAVKFTFDGAVAVRVRTQDDHAVVTVADTGIGIAEAEMPRLFERFHRVENARSRSSEGSGIGLALVKELVGLHGGTITADSAQDRGTTFTIRLPFGYAHLPADAVTEGPAMVTASASVEPFVEEAMRWLPDTAVPDLQPAAPGDAALPPRVGSPALTDAVRGLPARVLVADDNADMREYLTRLLRGAGHEVRAVTDGQAALETVRGELPDLVVSDVMMPRLDGLGLVAALRADRRTASVPVLLLSARAGQEASIQGLEAGADDYLVKPFSAAELLARVRANVELARLRSQHARWRTALVDSLQEGFFVCDADGTVAEINATFAEILGYGPDGLPYRPPLAWWPDPDTDPHAYQRVRQEFSRLVEDTSGEGDLPLVHRDGHRVWLRATFNRVEDPVAGRHVIVGTVRDITGEHYTVQRDTALAALAEQLAQADTVPEALAAAATELRRTWSAHHVTIAVFPPASAGSHREPDLVRTSEHSRWSDLAPELRTLLSALREAPPLAPQVDQPGCAGVTVGYPGGVLVVWIDLGDRRPFGAEDQALLSVLAGRLGQGVHRVHEIDQQREAAVALQHAILGPASLPGGFAVRYQPAIRPLQVGGDWYDTVPLAEGRIGIVVGDCVGHGLNAAAVMGQLRSACRALLLEHSSPARALAGLDRFAALLPGAECTTVFCAILDPASGELVYSSAGHPPPILVRADGTAATLDGGRGIPLGVRIDRHRDQDRLVIPARATLLLYTDGLIERRRRSLDDGIARAAAAVHDGRGMPVEELASHLMAVLTPEGGYEDDVALLLYRPPRPLEIEFVAAPSELAPVRHTLRDWLSRCDLNAQMINDVLIAVGEACNNAVEHGHREHPAGMVRLRAAALADQLWVSVIDSGRWKPLDPEATARGNRGRGIALMRGLMHHVTIDATESGTIVEMSTRIAT
ncbi:SpoIIE family protein phosphatase [Frankia sp. CNm7]|uniref:histidine kinase n=1 Tax=Frankia nepalensis TaxID=1836974 RepID=A0A937RKG3_9ACTN|nr:SpoIIE family protein phosphatase [Frankia nepalensis]MBL7512093.1 SpoIIE family protein phosphatase [Frankia nepalensis]MBL7523259.1 SpoIIE family protein phosphatase [Frankia nepalensis]MBL7631807.1 SpoIIE family protein phosphatase [Frankia nepalensis]